MSDHRPTPSHDNQGQAHATRPDHHPSVVDHNAMQGRPRRRRLWLRLTMIFLALAALFVVMLPTLLSTGPGTHWLVSLVNRKISGQLKVADLSLSWFGGQRIEGLNYDDAGQGLTLNVQSIDLPTLGLYDVLAGRRRLGDIRMGKVEVVYTQPNAQRGDPRNLPRKQDTSTREPIKLPAGLSGTLMVEALSVTYHSAEFEPIVWTSTRDTIRVTDIRDIGLEISAKVRQGTKSGIVEVSGHILNLFDPEGVEQANEAAYDLKAKVDGVPTSALDQLLRIRDVGSGMVRLVSLLGEGELVASAAVNGTIDALKSDLSITTPKLRVELHQVTEGKTMIASPDSYVRLALDQSGFASLFPKSGLKLVEPTWLELNALSFRLPVVQRSVDWEAARLSFRLQAGEDLAVMDERGEVLGIDGLRVDAVSDSIAGKVSFALRATLSAVDDRSRVTREPVALDVVVSEPMQATRQIDFFSEGLPIALADALVGQEGRLVLWLGRTLALQADVRGRLVNSEEGSSRLVREFALRPEGRVTGTVRGLFESGRYELGTPLNEPIEAVLTPEAFASLMSMLSGRPGKPALTIDQDMPVYVTLGDAQRGPARVTMRSDQSGVKHFYPDPDQTHLAALIELTPARVMDPTLKKTYELRGGRLLVSAPDLRGKAEVRAELDLWVRPDAGQQGVASLLTWQTTVTDLLDTEGRVPMDSGELMRQISADGGMRLANVPSGLIDSLLNREGDLASILGPIVHQLDAGFTYNAGQPTGATVQLNWDTENNQPLPDAWASMKPAAFDIDAQHMLSVRGGQDLELQVRVSEDFGNRWMGKLHPILFDAKSGDRPVKIKVDGKNFRFPLKGQSMQGARVVATVDLGTISFGDDALLGKLMQWTNRPGERAIFEPAIVKLIDGNLSYDQFSLAVGKVKLRLDGEVDLAKGQIVDMAVRVPGESLIRVFNELDGVIRPDDFLSIPMTGEIRNPKFDQQLIGREVARLLTRGLIEQQKDKLGDLIRKGLGKGDSSPPADATNPPQPDGQDQQTDKEPAQDPAKEVADELIDRGLDLLFKRLGRDKEPPKQE